MTQIANVSMPGAVGSHQQHLLIMFTVYLPWVEETAGCCNTLKDSIYCAAEM